MILEAIIATVIVTILGGGTGFFIWLKTRPKKETWKAYVYQLSDGEHSPVNERGEVVSDLKLKDLKPYAIDTLEKVEKEHGITIYRLVGLKRSTPAIEGDVVDYWGKDNKVVNVLLQKGGCTILKKGFDSVTSELIFNPLPYDRIVSLKSEIALKKDRLHKEKDILQAITPWIVAGICMLGLVAIAYIAISGFVDISENLKDQSSNVLELENHYASITGNVRTVPTTNPVGNQPSNK